MSLIIHLQLQKNKIEMKSRVEMQEAWRQSVRATPARRWPHGQSHERAGATKAALAYTKNPPV